MKFHQEAEQAVVREPVLLGGFEALKFVVKHLPGGGEFRPCELKQVALHAAHRWVIDARGLTGHADLVAGPSEIAGIEPRDFRRIKGQVNRIERAGGNRAVRAFVDAVFIDRQKLNECDAGLGGPVDPLAQSRGVADAKVSSASHRKDRDEDPGLANSSVLHGVRLSQGIAA